MNALIDPRLYLASSAFAEGKTTSVRDPWTGQELARVVVADAAQAARATDACGLAFDAMARSSSFDRRRWLLAIARGIEARASDLADLIAREAGKPIAAAQAEVARAVATFEIGAEESTRGAGEVMRLDITEASRGYRGQWTRVPAGPVIALAPFNFPLNLVAHKISPALAAGCSIVLKPPPQAPLTALALAAIVRASGLPDNAVQVVPCEVDVAESLVRSDAFATFSFTGSAKVGWHLKSVAGKKRVLLELGGNAAAIVHGDADVAYAADRIVAGAYGYAGQVCIKVQRAYVHAPIADAFIAAVVQRARAIAPRSPLEKDAVLGPMIDEANAARVEKWVAEAVAKGARPLVPFQRQGARVHPVLLEVDGDGAGMLVVDEEVFGPVLTVHRYQDWDQALTWADRTRYGLQAGIFTDSERRIRQAYERLHVGGLIVNDTPTFRVDSMPYGGTRDSGLGREGVRFAIEEMTERKLLVVRDRE